MDAPDYSRYTYDELIEARESVDATLYPERVAKLEQFLEHYYHPADAQNEQADALDKYRTFGPRLGAMIADSLLLSIGVGILSLLTGFRESPWFWWTDTAIFLIYPVLLHTLYGQTFGKMATDVIVLDEKTESAITFTQAALRDCVPIVSTLIIIGTALLVQIGVISAASDWLITGLSVFTWSMLIWHLLEVVTMLTNQKRRAIHDYIAGTVVVKT